MQKNGRKEGWTEKMGGRRIGGENSSPYQGRECGREANTGVVVALGWRLKSDRPLNKHSVTEYSNASQRHNHPSRRFTPVSPPW